MTGGLDGFKRFAASDRVAERCGLCSIPLDARHAHLWDVDREAMECACAQCGMLFDSSSPRWRPLHRRAERLEKAPIDDATWNALGLPIGLAWFVRDGRSRAMVARHPGPGGAVRCQLPVGLVHLDLLPDVEALLVNRLDGARDFYRVSIDHCYALTGELRACWCGFSGGSAVREAAASFFARLDGR